MIAGWLRALLVLLSLAVLFAIPKFTGHEYVLALGVSFATFSVLSSGLNLVYGYTGLLSFAQVGFFGIGGYTAALLVMERGWSLWAGAAAGGALATLVGLVIGYSSLRLSRHAFAIVSLSFALLCMIVARDWVSLTRERSFRHECQPRVYRRDRWRSQPSDFYLLLSRRCRTTAVYLVVTSRLSRAMRAIKLNNRWRSQASALSYRLLAIALSALLSNSSAACSSSTLRSSTLVLDTARNDADHGHHRRPGPLLERAAEQRHAHRTP
jgi:branched-chain amino acid transport system permease protein